MAFKLQSDSHNEETILKCPYCGRVVFNVVVIDSKPKHKTFGDTIKALICDDVDCEHIIRCR